MNFLNSIPPEIRTALVSLVTISIGWAIRHLHIPFLAPAYQPEKALPHLSDEAIAAESERRLRQPLSLRQRLRNAASQPQAGDDTPPAVN